MCSIGRKVGNTSLGDFQTVKIRTNRQTGGDPLFQVDWLGDIACLNARPHCFLACVCGVFCATGERFWPNEST